MLERDPREGEQPIPPATPPNSVPSWDREALALKIQATDGCTSCEATLQIDAMAQSLHRLP